MSGVPVAVAAKVYGKDPAWVRAGIICGWLPIGTATRKGKQITDLSNMDSRKGRINYYISPKLLYEMTGYDWRIENGSDGKRIPTERAENRTDKGAGHSQMAYI